MKALTESVFRLCIAALGFAIALGLTSAAINELSRHVAEIILIALLVIGFRIVWQRSSF